jgi:hypothetical protein
MIIIKPDNKIKKRFKDIDFRSLSLVYSLLFDNVYKAKKKRTYNLSLKLTAGEYSYYTQQQGRNIRINISELIFDEKQFHLTLLHEFRHFVQDKALRIPWTRKFYDDRTVYKYMMSPAEIDADNFSEKSVSKVICLYKRMVKFKSTVEDLSNFKGK